MSNKKNNQQIRNDSPQATQAATVVNKPKMAIQKFIFPLIVLAIAVVGTLTGVLVWYFSMPSVEQAFKSIEKNNNYAYTAYVSRPTISNQIIYIKNTHTKRSVDTGINQFVVDYSVSSESVGVYTEINNVWVYDDVFRGDEGTGLNSDNRAIKAFNLAVEDLLENFEYNKTSKCYELKESSYHKIYANSLGGSCDIYRKDGKIYIDTFYGLDGNNKERIIITKVGGVNIKLPKLTNMGL